MSLITGLFIISSLPHDDFSNLVLYFCLNPKYFSILVCLEILTFLKIRHYLTFFSRDTYPTTFITSPMKFEWKSLCLVHRLNVLEKKVEEEGEEKKKEEEENINISPHLGEKLSKFKEI